MKRIVVLLAAVFAFAACTKSSESNLISQRSLILSKNTTSTFGRWKLQGIEHGAISLSLTSSQSSFEKVYQSNGNFFDTDGLTGKWEISAQDSLIEYFSNFNTGVMLVQKYKINILTTTQLNLTYFVNGMEITSNYKAIP